MWAQTSKKTIYSCSSRYGIGCFQTTVRSFYFKFLLEYTKAEGKEITNFTSPSKNHMHFLGFVFLRGVFKGRYEQM